MKSTQTINKAYISLWSDEQSYNLWCTLNRLKLCENMEAEEDFEYHYTEYVNGDNEIDYFEERYVCGYTISWKNKNE